jgi:type IV pilus assembly protein PilA
MRTGTLRAQRGFTLLELMLVVGLIGMLAAIAVPAYQDFTNRAYVSEAFSLAAPSQRAVAEYYERWGRLPADNAAAGLYAPEAWRGKAVTAVRVVDGMIEVDIDGKRFEGVARTIFLRPALNKANPTGPFIWTCDASKWPDAFEPRGTIRTAALLSPKYLPAVCR